MYGFAILPTRSIRSFVVFLSLLMCTKEPRMRIGACVSLLPEAVLLTRLSRMSFISVRVLSTRASRFHSFGDFDARFSVFLDAISRENPNLQRQTLAFLFVSP